MPRVSSSARATQAMPLVSSSGRVLRKSALRRAAQANSNSALEGWEYLAHGRYGLDLHARGLPGGDAGFGVFDD